MSSMESLRDEVAFSKLKPTTRAGGVELRLQHMFRDHYERKEFSDFAADVIGALVVLKNRFDLADRLLKTSGHNSGE